MKRILIIGAGISGMIAEGAFSEDPDNQVMVIDPFFDEHKIMSSHKAVMRLRDERIKKYVPCDLQEIVAHKAIVTDGKIVDSPTIRLNNLYSLKTYGSLGVRSLNDLGAQKRFLFNRFKKTDWNLYDKDKLLGVAKKACWTSKFEHLEYDICISTIPMPHLLKITMEFMWPSDIVFKSNPIYITTGTLIIDSNVHQTLYFVDSETPIYRATIESKSILIEAIEEPDNDDIEYCISCFGIELSHVTNWKRTEQKMGKIFPIDDTVRKRIMMDLTEHYNVYSFGRFATWKSLRIDQTLDDIERIKMMIKVRSGDYYS